jgi:hypothetical protein
MQPPVWFPDWLIWGLGLVLPWLYQQFISKLTGVWKTVVTAVLAVVIATVAGVFFLHIQNLGDLIKNALLIWGAITFIYQLIAKRVFAKIKAKMDSTTPPSS